MAEIEKQIDKILLGGGGHTWQRRKIMKLIAQERKEAANDAWYDVNSKTPREGEFVLARLVWDSGKETYAVLEYKILDDNAPWVMDGSELSFWITVTHWRYFAKLQSNTKEKN